MPARSTWTCTGCGRVWPLSRDCCHNDDCEMGRWTLEDEQDHELPAIRSPHKGEE